MTITSNTAALSQILPEGVTLLAGPPKGGKSTLALDIALAVAAGEPALGYASPAGDVLYAALEGAPETFVRRVLRRSGGQWPDRFWWTSLLPDVHTLAETYRIIPRRPRLVVVDSLSRLAPGPSATTVQALGDFGRKLGIAVLLTHLTRRATVEALNETLYGPSPLASAADALWLLRRQGEEGSLTITGRAFPDTQLALRLDAERQEWRLRDAQCARL